MSPQPSTTSEREQHLQSVVLSYLLAADAGQAPDQGEFVARHPDLAAELAAFFADQERLAVLLGRPGGVPRTSRPPVAGAPPGGPAEPGPRAGDTGGEESESTGPHKAPGGPPPEPDTAPPSIPGYEILGELGKGGMGVVYKARQVSLNRVVAVKMIRAQRVPSDAVRARFRAEAQIVARFDHPNIVRVHESAEYAGLPYFVLEYVSGGSLAERRKDGAWAPATAAGLVAQLADAVDYAHRQGIVHRDLKPANVLLTGDGTPKVTDFGLSKQLQADAACLTRAGDLVGTPAYMAPEQAEGRAEAIGAPTDVFGLGAILYDLLTGRPPFEGQTIEEVMRQARQGQVRPPRQVNPRVPAALERVCLRATAADPQQRYPSAAALGEDLRRYLRRSRRRAGLWLAGGVAALLAAGVLAALLGSSNPRPSPGGRDLTVPAPPDKEKARPADLARKAGEILQAHCYRCHGQDGNVEGGFNYVLDPPQLLARRSMVVPGKPEKSRLLQRVVSGEMPPEGEEPRPSEADATLLKQWIEAGAPAFGPSAPGRDFLSPADVLRLIRADLERAQETDRAFLRYFTITHLYNAGLPEDGLQTYRFGLAKLINSLSWHRRITVPAAIDPARTIFRIDLRDYQWNERVWKLILAAYPYGVTYRTDVARFVYAATHCGLPHVRADWFVFAASRPPLYHEVLQLPATAGKLEELLRVDVAENIRQMRVARAGFNGSGVSINNRLIERHESTHGAYWKSYDFAAAEGPDGDLRNVFLNPLGPGHGKKAFRHDGGEIIFNLPNGLQAYMLVNGQGERIDRGPTNIVKDVKQREGAVVNGISCMSCHVRGMVAKDDQVRASVAKNPRAFGEDEAATVRALYPTRDVFGSLLQQDAERFAGAVKGTGARLSATDPVVALASRYEWDLDRSLAAAEAGVRGAELSNGLKRSDRLARIFGPLEIKGGTVQRQVFAANFGDLVRELRVGDFRPAGPAADAPVKDDNLIENSLGMKLRRIPAGKFLMGSPEGEPERGTDEQQHEVEITRSFHLGTLEVTQEQYTRVVGKNPSHFSAGGRGKELVKGLDTGNFPVEGVSWEDARDFCAKLSGLPAERRLGRVYRLPTEAEWEYACRAGCGAAYSFGGNPGDLDEHGWHAGDAGGRPHPVGEKKPNAWGLYDMHGNVAEWCADRYGGDYYEASPPRDPRGPVDKHLPLRVLRGGSWEDSAGKARSAGRHQSLANFRLGATRYGFRVVLE